MCKGTTYGNDHCYYIPREKFSDEMKKKSSRSGILVDKCIGKEVEWLIQQGIATIGHSCCGHGKEHSQVWIYKEYKNICGELGYKVVEYDEQRTKQGVLACLLKTGTQNKPVKYNGYIHLD